jgi:hypothetical protein
MRKQADVLKVCPIPDACSLVMAQRPYRLIGSPETRPLIFLIKNSPDQVEGYLDYLQPAYKVKHSLRVRTQLIDQISNYGLLHRNRVCVLGVLSLSQSFCCC